MSADTLTDAQARVLRLARDGLVVAVWRGGYGEVAGRPSWAVSGRVTRPTLQALWRRCLIRRAGGLDGGLPLHDTNYRIARAVLTAAGREALARHEAGEQHG